MAAGESAASLPHRSPGASPCYKVCYRATMSIIPHSLRLSFLIILPALPYTPTNGYNVQKTTKALHHVHIETLGKEPEDVEGVGMSEKWKAQDRVGLEVRLVIMDYGKIKN